MGFELEIWTIAVLSSAFFVSGFIDSVAGGGGLINIPSLLLAGVSPEFALGTTKMSATIGRATALINYAKSGFVHWRVGLIGLPCAILGGILGAKAILLFDSEIVGKMIVFLLPLGISAVFLPKSNRATKVELDRAKLYCLTPVICFALGFYDGFFGPGTGSFFIIALNLFVGLSFVQAAATTKVFNCTTSFSSFVVFAINGKVLFLLGIPLALASIAGNILGSSLAIKIGSVFIKKILFLSLSLLFATLVWKFFLNG